MIDDPEDPVAVDEEQFEPDNAAETVTEDASSKKRYRKSVREQKKTEMEAGDFWRQVLAHPVGRREIWKLLSDAHAFNTEFACGPNGFPQVQATWFKAGEQGFGLRFYHSLLVHDRDGVFLMHDEYDPRFKKQ